MALTGAIVQTEAAVTTRVGADALVAGSTAVTRLTVASAIATKAPPAALVGACACATVLTLPACVTLTRLVDALAMTIAVLVACEEGAIFAGPLFKASAGAIASAHAMVGAIIRAFHLLTCGTYKARVADAGAVEAGTIVVAVLLTC